METKIPDLLNPVGNDIKGLKFWLAWILIIGVYILMRVNIIDIPLDRDEGMLGYIGQLILDNGVMYRDAVDMKAPVAHYLNAFALLFVPATPAGMHVFLQIYNFLTLVTLFFVAKIYCRSNSAGLLVAFIYGVFSSAPTIQGFTSSTEMYLILPISLSLLFAILTIRQRNSYFALTSGLASALAFWTKPTSLPICFFILLYLLVGGGLPYLRQAYRQILRWALMWCVGFVAVALPICSYFYYHGAFHEFIYWCFIHSYYYVRQWGAEGNLGRILGVLINIFEGNYPIIIIGLLGSLVAILKKDEKGYFLLTFLLFSLMATYPGHIFPHYFAQIAPAVALAAGIGWFFLADLIKRKALRKAFTFVYILLILIIPVSAYSAYYILLPPDEISRAFFGPEAFPESLDVADFIRERTDRDDTVYIFGSEPQILFYAGRKSASPITHVYPLTTVFPRYKEFQQTTWGEINIRQPKYIVMVDVPMSILYDGIADLWIIDKIRGLLDEDYFLEAVMPVVDPKDKLMTASTESNLEKSPYKYDQVIRIYRRRM